MKQKTILITGATSGFGHGLVQRLLKDGQKVVATGRNLSQRKEIFARERLQFGDDFLELDLDVTSSEQRHQLVQFLAGIGGIDVLVNNAGYGLFGPLEGLKESEIRHQLEVNFFGPTLLTRDLLPHLRRSQGLVINLSSVLGFVGFPLASLYCASKFAIEGLSESLAYELAPHGVGVVLIQPGGFKTSFQDKLQWSQLGDPRVKAYETQLLNYKKLRDKQNQSPVSQDPKQVINLIAKTIQQDQKKLRYTVGRDALMSRMAKAVLPQHWFESLLSRFFKMTLKGPDKL